MPSSVSAALTLQHLREELSQLQEHELTGLLNINAGSTASISKGESSLLEFNGGGNKENSAAATNADTQTAGKRSSLMHEYETARDAYLRSKLTTNLLRWVSHYQHHHGDDNSNSKSDNNRNTDTVVSSLRTLTQEAWQSGPTLEEREELSKRRDQVMARLQVSCQRAKAMQAQLRAKHEAHQARKEELLQLIAQAESENQKNDVGDDMAETELGNDENNNNDDQSLDEEDFAALHDRLTKLRHRRVELQVQLHEAQTQTKQMEKEWRETTKKELEDMPSPFKLNRYIDDSEEDLVEVAEESIAALKEENSKLEAQLERYRGTADFYRNMTLVLEELRGIRVIETKTIGQTTEQSEKDHAAIKRVLLRVRLLDRFDVIVELGGRAKGNLSCNNSTCCKSQYRVVAANFCEEVILSSIPCGNTPRSGYVVVSCHDENEHSGAPIELKLPSLHDLVNISQRMKPVESLRFVLREASSRVVCLEARIKELVRLQQELGNAASRDGLVLSSLGQHNADGDEIGSLEQDVLCPFQLSTAGENTTKVDDGMAVVIRMTMDCPLLPGSVHIHQIGKMRQQKSTDIISVESFELETIYDKNEMLHWERIRADLNRRRFSGPVALIRALKEVGSVENQ